ncbi:MAG: glycoside hydrolase family 18 protein [Chloroflexota bacterium]
MKHIQRIFIAIAAITIIIGTQTQTFAQETAPKYKIVGYYTSYSIYTRQYFVTDIPANQLTHLNYAALDVSDNGQCVTSDLWADMQYSYPSDKPAERLRGNFKQLQLLKKANPNLKILMTVGGWEQSKNFSNAALTQQSRIRFGRSCVAFMKEYGFDGIDIDWRYPVSGGLVENSGHPEDRENFTLLLAELRGQLEYWSQRDNTRYLLTIAAPAVAPLFKNMQLDQIHPYVDWINLTAYGFQGDWSDLASHQAPLFGSVKDPRGDTIRNDYNVAGAVKAYLDAGVPAEKIVVGVPFFAQAWRNVKPNDYFGLYQTPGGVPTGTRPGGILYYRDLLPLLKSDSYTHFFDTETKTPWMYNANGGIAISYEDPNSIQNKAAYVMSTGLGGIMIWELDFDDDTHTLLNAVYTGLNPKP